MLAVAVSVKWLSRDVKEGVKDQNNGTYDDNARIAGWGVVVVISVLKGVISAIKN